MSDTYVCTKCKNTFNSAEAAPKTLPLSGLIVCPTCFPTIRAGLIKAARTILPSAWLGI